MSWQEVGLRNPSLDPSKARQEAQMEWAKRRQEHINAPNPGPYEAIKRRLGNLASNFGLERAERRDQSWEHHPTDYLEGSYLQDSPIDTKRFNVYEAMLEAARRGKAPAPEIEREWQIIRRGEVPYSP